MKTMRRGSTIIRVTWFTTLLLALFSVPSWGQVPQDMTFTGRLVTDAGVPVVGPVHLQIRIFDMAAGGSQLFGEDHLAVALDPTGHFSLQIGLGTSPTGPFDATLFDDVDRWIEVVLEGEVLTPRQIIGSVPWALIAQQANELVPDPNAPVATLYRSIPASAFTAWDSSAGWSGNTSGTNRHFTNATAYLFAPVELPHGATVTHLLCGGLDDQTDVKVQFVLRRNQPQIANVDMAVAESTFAATGFQFVSTPTIASPQIDNATFNYYLIAQTIHFDVGFCPGCTVNFCRISYTP